MLKALWLIWGTISLIGISLVSLPEDTSQKVSITALEPVEQIILPVTFNAIFQVSKIDSLQTARQVNTIENLDDAKLLTKKTGTSMSDQNTLIDTEYVSQNDLQQDHTIDDSVGKNHNYADTLYMDSLSIAEMASEKYVHRAPSFEFLIPVGWYIVQGSNSNRALLMPTSQNTINGTDNFIIVMSVRNLSEAATTPESLYNNCVNELSYKIVNKIPIREKRSTCDDHNYEGYSFVKNRKIVTIAYITLPQGDKFKEDDYERLVSTLKVDDPSPVKDTWRQANGFQVYHKKIPTSDSELEMKYYSVSQIDEFAVDLKNKQIMLTVSESKNLGSTIIPISELFVKPYVIFVDGNESEGVLIKDETEGISEMFILYKKGTHTIKISGTDLVPTLASKSLETPEQTKDNPNTQQSSTNSFKDAIYGWIRSIQDLFD